MMGKKGQKETKIKMKWDTETRQLEVGFGLPKKMMIKKTNSQESQRRQETIIEFFN